MRKPYRLFLQTCFALCAMVALSLPSFAQWDKQELGAGRSFHFGIPHCAKPMTEGARGVPLQLWIGSKVKNKVIVEAPAINFVKAVSINANEVKTIDIPEGLMNLNSEQKMPYGITVKAVEPVTVTLYLSYKVSGEATTVIPDEYLGKKYYAMSMWQDQTDEYKPGQILIVATQDNTNVSYLPPAATAKVKAKQWGKVTLQKGETFLIHSKVQPAYNQQKETDLTGTYIEATKPVAVFSGHTKGAFPRFSSTMLGTPANFMRNMMVDQMWPIEQLGTEYVSVPVQYQSRPYNGQDFDGEGDLERFVATQDGTDISETRPDGTLRLLKKGMNKGDVYDITTQLKAAHYVATKPVLVAKFGKAWRVGVVPPIITPDGKREQILNPARNGEGMMYVLVPRNSWSSHAIFRSPGGMNNFINVTFPTDQVDNLKFDNRKFRAAFGSKIQVLEGTPYSYVATLIGSEGTHVIEAEEGAEDAKFAAYVYGNYDATKDGFAYGYPVGVNYALNLPPDSILIETTMKCGNVEGKVTIIHATDDFAGLHSIAMDATKSANYLLGTTPDPVEIGSDKAEFTLTVIDPTQDAKATVYITDRTGNRHIREFEYIAEKLVSDPVSLDFGLLTLGQELCKQLKLTNPTEKAIEVSNLHFKDGRVEFVLKSINGSPASYPFTIEPKQTVTIEICGTAQQEGETKDMLVANLECSNPEIEVKLVSGQPIVTMEDWNFGDVPLGLERSKTITITNISKTDIAVQLDKVDWADKTHFRTEGLLDKLPIILPKKGDQFTFTVFYQPTVKDVQDQTVAQFEGNTTIDKTFSEWKGRGVDAGLYITGHDFEKNRTDGGTVTYPEGEFGVTAGSATDITVQKIEIVSEPGYEGDEAAFGFDEAKFNADYKGKILHANPPTVYKDLPYYFTPTEEREYRARIVITGTTPGNETKTASGLLIGVGILPHVAKTDVDYDRILVNTTKTDNAFVRNTSATAPLVVKNFSISGTDKQYFSIDPSFDVAATRTIAIGGELAIPVTFKPTEVRDKPGTGFVAQIDFEDDAPEEVHPQLVGWSYDVGEPNAEAKGWDFNPIYTHTNSNDALFYTPVQIGSITVENTGDIDATITDWQMDAGDATYFIAPATKPISLTKAGTPDSKVTIPGFIFANPTAVRNYAATVRIEVKYDNNAEGILYATLTGSAKELPVTVSIPTGYKVDPGQDVLIDFNIKNNDANEPLTKAKLMKFHATVRYNPQVIRVGKPGADLKAAIVFDNSTVIKPNSGWTVNNAQLVPVIGSNLEELTLELVNQAEDQPLVLAGTEKTPLFKFLATAYIAVDKRTELPCTMTPVTRDFVIVSEEPGDLLINPICVGDSRAIRVRQDYQLGSIAPNPVSSNTEITYSLAFEAPTRLVVVNSVGEEVAVLVDGIQTEGTYAVPLNVSNLAAGVYFYRLTSGPFSDTKTINVVK